MASFVDQLSAARSFYGYCAPEAHERKGSDINSVSLFEDAVTTHETLYSLLLSLLPSMEHVYEVGCTIDSKNDDNIDDIRKKCLLILETALNAFRQYGGWIVPKVKNISCAMFYICIQLGSRV